MIYTIDECGFFQGGPHFFNIKDVKCLIKRGDTFLDIVFGSAHVSIAWPEGDSVARDGIFDMIAKMLVEGRRSSIDASAKEEAMRRAQLEIQNRMAGKFINDGCNH